MKDKIPGGLADGMPDSDFPEDQIEMGIDVEKEHTNDPAIAKEIAKDHLTESDEYYTYLDEMENIMEKSSAFRGINSLEELMTLATFPRKKKSIDDHFNEEVRNVLSCIIDMDFNLPDEEIIKLATDEILDVVQIKAHNIRGRVIPEVKKQFEYLKRLQRSKP